MEMKTKEHSEEITGKLIEFLNLIRLTGCKIMSKRMDIPVSTDGSRAIKKSHISTENDPVEMGFFWCEETELKIFHVSKYYL